MSAPRPAAVFFDLDGTLMDREPLAQAAVHQVAVDHGAPYDQAELAPLVGRAWQDVHVHLAVEERFGWTLEEFLGQVFDTADRLMDEGFETRILEGGVELITRLRADGVPVWLVTGSLRREADVAIRRLGITELLVGSLAAEDYGAGKPDPGCYLLAAARAGVAEAHHRCIVVEDSAPGVAAGLAAGMRVLGTNAANRPVDHPSYQDLSRAHVVVGGLDEVDDVVLRQLLVD